MLNEGKKFGLRKSAGSLFEGEGVLHQGGVVLVDGGHR